MEKCHVCSLKQIKGKKYFAGPPKISPHSLSLLSQKNVPGFFFIFFGIRQVKFSPPELYKPHITPLLISACHVTLHNKKALHLGSKKNVMCVTAGDE